MNDESIKPKKRFKKIILFLSITIAVIITLAVTFISPLIKYLVEKYDTKYTGREIKMNWAYVNPFTGYVHFDKLKIFEAKSDSLFFSVDGVSANFKMLKMLSKTYEISTLTLDNPKGIIIRTNNIFNFNDLILKFSPNDTLLPKKNKEPLHFNILNITINNGRFYIREPHSPINYSFLKVNFKSDGKLWNSDTINGKLTLISGVGSGHLKANFLINTNTLDYNFEALITKFNLNVMKQYLKALANYGNISGELNANINASGNLKSKQNINGKGYININNFHFGKDSLNDFVSYKRLKLVFKQIAPAIKKYLIDTVRLENPYCIYEKYDHLDNIQNMFGKNGSKVSAAKNNTEKFNLIIKISEYIQAIFKNFLQSDYKVRSLAVVDANFKFNDYSGTEKFAMALYPLNINGDSIDNTDKWVKLTVNSGIKPYGLFGISLRMNPATNKDFDMSYKFQKISAPLFNPYLISLTSFPLDRGKIELFGNWSIRNNNISSNNHLLIIDPRLSSKIKKKGARWIPMRLIMFFVREGGNVIDYEIPINGDLKNPKFKLKDAIFDVVKNVFVKPPTTPYRFEVKNTENEIEKSLMLTWLYGQTDLYKSQEKFIKKIVKFLQKNPEAKISVQPFSYEEKEKEYILFFEAKKKYYLSQKNKSEKFNAEYDSLVIEKTSIKDADFLKYVQRQITDTNLVTIQQKCNRLVNSNTIDAKYNHLLKSRKEVFIDYFEENNLKKQVSVISYKNTIPFNGFSYFKINYKGQLPEELIEAYDNLTELNDNAPRDKYKKYRKRKSL